MSDFRVSSETVREALCLHTTARSPVLIVLPHTRHKTRSSIVYSPHRTFDSFLDGTDPVCAALGWTQIHTGAGAAAAFWRRPADINNDGGPKMAVQVRNSTKCHLGQHSLKSKESWLENILKVFVCVVSTQTHLVQSVHCVQRGCGLPSRGPVSRFPATVRHSPFCSQLHTVLFTFLPQECSPAVPNGRGKVQLWTCHSLAVFPWNSKV